MPTDRRVIVHLGVEKIGVGRRQRQVNRVGWGLYRFFSVTPTPAPSINRNEESKSGFFVMASMYFGFGLGCRMLWAIIKPPGRTKGNSLSK
jgi:hypothetical protein